ncbi:hypothetical protein K470DRAFT_262766 [Piedraia hortae CBS 480.64]|uniref:Uncharacterized protein n=1 Tax=Piedraia hortae CBS 480.64 TaxID=1314780 RepID=A0A6A7C578_9PEZI|nr:hypothetical protein K470DRAFT_262766 [Piedraia hortae CBS 480.64]
MIDAHWHSTFRKLYGLTWQARECKAYNRLSGLYGCLFGSFVRYTGHGAAVFRVKHFLRRSIGVALLEEWTESSLQTEEVFCGSEGYKLLTSAGHYTRSLIEDISDVLNVQHLCGHGCKVTWRTSARVVEGETSEGSLWTHDEEGSMKWILNSYMLSTRNAPAIQ